jgi:hypothetical protein
MTIYVLGAVPGKFKLFIVSIRIRNRKWFWSLGLPLDQFNADCDGEMEAAL